MGVKREAKAWKMASICLFISCEEHNNTLRRSPGLGVCGSDIRQHVKLQGIPQQCNCGWLIDRLLETKQVKIASHFHAPTLRVPHKGERLVAGEDACTFGVCVWVCGWMHGCAAKWCVDI